MLGDYSRESIVGSAALAEVCALLGAIAVVYYCGAVYCNRSCVCVCCCVCVFVGLLPR